MEYCLEEARAGANASRALLEAIDARSIARKRPESCAGVPWLWQVASGDDEIEALRGEALLAPRPLQPGAGQAAEPTSSSPIR
jgi:hypothetical protein